MNMHRFTEGYSGRANGARGAQASGLHCWSGGFPAQVAPRARFDFEIPAEALGIALTRFQADGRCVAPRRLALLWRIARCSMATLRGSAPAPASATPARLWISPMKR